jgi:hypothetical protein
MLQATHASTYCGSQPRIEQGSRLANLVQLSASPSHSWFSQGCALYTLCWRCYMLPQAVVNLLLVWHQMQLLDVKESLLDSCVTAATIVPGCSRKPCEHLNVLHTAAAANI